MWCLALQSRIDFGKLLVAKKKQEAELKRKQEKEKKKTKEQVWYLKLQI